MTPRLSAHARRLWDDGRPLSSLPERSTAPGQLGWSFSFVFPIPLPPEVAKGITFFPAKSPLSKKVLMMVGAMYHQQ